MPFWRSLHLEEWKYCRAQFYEVPQKQNKNFFDNQNDIWQALKTSILNTACNTPPQCTTTSPIQYNTYIKTPKTWDIANFSLSACPKIGTLRSSCRSVSKLHRLAWLTYSQISFLKLLLYNCLNLGCTFHKNHEGCDVFRKGTKINNILQKKKKN